MLRTWHPHHRTGLDELNVDLWVVKGLIERDAGGYLALTDRGRAVHLWGLVGSESERQALLTLVREVPGVSAVADEMIPAY